LQLDGSPGTLAPAARTIGFHRKIEMIMLRFGELQQNPVSVTLRTEEPE
jgi:hypothetical protein